MLRCNHQVNNTSLISGQERNKRIDIPDAIELDIEADDAEDALDADIELDPDMELALALVLPLAEPELLPEDVDPAEHVALVGSVTPTLQANGQSRLVHTHGHVFQRLTFYRAHWRIGRSLFIWSISDPRGFRIAAD